MRLVNPEPVEEVMRLDDFLYNEHSTEAVVYRSGSPSQRSKNIRRLVFHPGRRVWGFVDFLRLGAFTRPGSESQYANMSYERGDPMESIRDAIAKGREVHVFAEGEHLVHWLIKEWEL